MFRLILTTSSVQDILNTVVTLYKFSNNESQGSSSILQHVPNFSMSNPLQKVTIEQFHNKQINYEGVVVVEICNNLDWLACDSPTLLNETCWLVSEKLLPDFSIQNDVFDITYSAVRKLWRNYNNIGTDCTTKFHQFFFRWTDKIFN